MNPFFVSLGGDADLARRGARRFLSKVNLPITLTLVAAAHHETRVDPFCVSFSFLALIIINTTPERQHTRTQRRRAAGQPPRGLAITRCCHDQYCIVYGIQKGGCGGIVYCENVVQ